MKRFVTVLSMAILSTGSFSASAQDAVQRNEKFNLEEDVAISGYDPVSYFKNNMAVRGQSSLAVFHQGVIYHFASLANKEEFKKNPTRYEPQYGGWCAYAMGAKGSRVPVNPETFKILNGKLYLFYNKRGNNTLDSWNKDEERLRKKADANWNDIFN